MIRRSGLIPATGLGDLIRALGMLDPDEATLAEIAGLLGIRSMRRESVKEPQSIENGLPDDDDVDAVTSPSSDVRAAVVHDLPPPGTRDVPMTAMPLQSDVPLPPLPTRSLDVLLPEGAAPPVVTSLFAKAHARALTRAVASGLLQEGDVDVAALVSRLATRQPIAELPREWLHTTGGSLEVLVDMGSGMAPYDADARELSAALLHEVGPDTLTMRWFEDCPLLAPGVRLAGAVASTDYRLPSTETRVLVVTVFGVRGVSPPRPEVIDGWHRFVEAARRAGIRLLGLTPLHRAGLPDDVPRGMPIVTWDRTTDVRQVHHAVKRAAVP